MSIISLENSGGERTTCFRIRAPALTLPGETLGHLEEQSQDASGASLSDCLYRLNKSPGKIFIRLP